MESTNSLPEMNNDVRVSLPIIQGLWTGSRLSLMEKLSIASFIKNGHEYHLYAYEDIKDVPKGTLIKDANAIIPKGQLFVLRDRNTTAGFANLFRYRLLFEKGGYWCDTDVICLKPFDFETDYVFGLENYRRSRSKINNAIIKAPADSALLRFCYETARNEDPKELVWGVIGPELFGSAVAHHGMTGQALPPYVFYPLEWWKWRDALAGGLFTRTAVKLKSRQSHAIHLWQEMWRLEEIDKNATYDFRCIYEVLKRRYL
jgi:hypothetical protein